MEVVTAGLVAMAELTNLKSSRTSTTSSTGMVICNCSAVFWPAFETEVTDRGVATRGSISVNVVTAGEGASEAWVASK